MQTQNLLFLLAGLVLFLGFFSYLLQKRPGFKKTKKTIYENKNSNEVIESFHKEPVSNSQNSVSFGFKFGMGIFPWLVLSGLITAWIINKFFEYKIQKFIEETEKTLGQIFQ